MVNKFNNRFYIKYLLIWICKELRILIQVLAEHLILVQNFYLQMEAWAEISLFFGVDMSSSENADNKNKDKLNFGE